MPQSPVYFKESPQGEGTPQIHSFVLPLAGRGEGYRNARGL